LASQQTPAPTPVPVVGIGASAGGIEALQAFFEAIPDDLGLAYVVIVHLAPDRESDLPEILGRQTSMPVTQVGDHDKVDLVANHVYVIAPNRKLEISDTAVGSSRFEMPRGQRAAIDLFFRSLAAAHGDGFAVVLSGSGSDGALGAKAIKEAGGLVLVQDPQEAGHDGMPRAVISTGTADVVLPVRELAARLAAIARHQDRVVRSLQLAASDTPPAEHAEAEARAEADAVRNILGVLRARTGHDFSKYKRNTVLRRVVRRMQLHHAASLADYHRYLVDDADEAQNLYNDLLISVTSFFRDQEAWEALRQEVIGPLLEQVPPEQQIRIWVAGCATGEEAYTLAILFQEEIQRRRILHDFVIFASDVDEMALAAAREGRYPAAVAADLSEARLERFFRKEDHHFRVSEQLRHRVVFTAHNVLRDPPFSRLHLVVCRNLLIYLDRDLQEQLMGVFHYACANDGHLFLGQSESADDELFHPIDKAYRIYQARPGTMRWWRDLPDLIGGQRGASVREPAFRSPQRPAKTLHAEALEDMAPPSVVVDSRWNVLHLSESAGRYLLQRGGLPAQAIMDLVRTELQGELQNALHCAFEARQPKLSAFVRVHLDGVDRHVAVLAQWRPPAEGEDVSALVTFLDAGEVPAELQGPGQAPDAEQLRELRAQLRQAEQSADLMRDDQHLANEDLRAANEELQSLNEEYRSTTEELETSKEELQSINEELHTVNNELKMKLEEVSRAHNDIKNLMDATDIPILFLARDLTINRFTPQVSALFNITTRDLGRPITDFTQRHDYATLAEDASEVIATLAPVTREAASRDGRFFVIRLRPYRTADDHVDGVVVTFIDITELKHATSVLRESESRFRALVEASAQMVWTADADGELLETSASWEDFTGQPPALSRGDGWFAALHPDDRDACAAAWRAAIEQGAQFACEFRLRHAPSDDYRWMSARAVPLRSPDGKIRGWVGMNVDITAWRGAVDALREADQQKDEFLAMLGHELRNPLAAIRNTVEAIGVAGANDADVGTQAWGVVDRQSRHMHRLVNDLLDVERIKRGRLTLSRQPVELCECIEDVAEALRGQIEQAGLVVELDLPAEPLMLVADPERLVQMIDNLVRNSIKYTEKGGRITISARKAAGAAVIAVQDTGVGIDPQEADKLFEPYYQVHDGGPRDGLGLGLTLVRRLAEMHGGSVQAHSDGPGSGSTFTITVPASDAATPAAPPAVPRPRSFRVLVVDDQADIADAFGAILRALGQHVEVAYDGETALEIARKHMPQVVFLDLSMPGMDGLELARRLRKELSPDQTALIAVSGLGENHAPDADGLFADRLLKPAGVASLVRILDSLPV
jgi:two-component system, chemotaxis family, CheB/CheR fusion protein